MKKNKFTEFLKGKGYFVLLFVGIIAIAVVALVGSQLSPSEKVDDKKYVDLNETDKDVASNNKNNETAQNDPISDEVVNSGSNSEDTTKDNSAEVASNEVEYEDFSQAVKDTKKDEPKKNTVETAAANVKNENPAKVTPLSFSSDDMMSWPVSGDVIMNYSMDRTIYFSTLMQYKCNPAIILSAAIGTEVKAARDGEVTAINEYHEETGYTITMDIGSGYSVVYGQLDKDSVSLKVGDRVKEGEVIGVIAKPTKYYSIEGSNLYFKVLQNEETVNPMLFLQ